MRYELMTGVQTGALPSLWSKTVVRQRTAAAIRPNGDETNVSARLRYVRGHTVIMARQSPASSSETSISLVDILQIGRASCRERVDISAGAKSVKRKVIGG